MRVVIGTTIRTFMLLGLAYATAQTPREAGPLMGAPIPAFEAIDHTGARQTFASIAGPKGAVLVFYRSADW